MPTFESESLDCDSAAHGGPSVCLYLNNDVFLA